MFVHTVFFWLKDPESTSQRAALYAGLQELATIAEIKTAYVGVAADTRRPVIDSTYDFSVTFIFETPQLQDIYQEHPDHKKFIENCAHTWGKVQVYDAVPYLGQ